MIRSGSENPLPQDNLPTDTLQVAPPRPARRAGLSLPLLLSVALHVVIGGALVLAMLPKTGAKPAPDPTSAAAPAIVPAKPFTTPIPATTSQPVAPVSPAVLPAPKAKPAPIKAPSAKAKPAKTKPAAKAAATKAKTQSKNKTPAKPAKATKTKTAKQVAKKPAPKPAHKAPVLDLEALSKGASSHAH